jgi:two-component system, OmpR family, copper resistance phosphate regulon response regulator CusR
MKVLLVEDDSKTAQLVQKGLTSEGYVVDIAGTGEDGLHMASSGQYDVVLLDVMLPGMDGYSVLEQIRSQNLQVHVVMLTARDAVQHKVKGLTLGADDYMTKPFAFAELLARIKSVLRRTGTPVSEVMTIDDLTVDPARHRVKRGEAVIDLSAKEILLLSLLMRHQGSVLSRTYIAEQVWDSTFEGDSNVVDVNIRRLRSKIDDPYDRKIIHTVRGRGYVAR